MKERQANKDIRKGIKDRLGVLSLTGLTLVLLASLAVMTVKCSTPIKQDSSSGTSTLPLQEGMTSTIVDFKTPGK